MSPQTISNKMEKNGLLLLIEREIKPLLILTTLTLQQ